MNRYTIEDGRLSNGDAVYYIYDYLKEEFLKKEYTEFDIVEEDCAILNEANQIELATY